RAIAVEFGVPGTTVHRHLNTYQLQKAGGQQLDVPQQRKGRRGHPPALIDPWEVPTVHRTSYRKWGAKAGVPLSSLWRLSKQVGVRRQTKWVKLTLTDKQRVDRVGFVLSHLHRRGGSGVSVDDMFDWVHVDKMWFYLPRTATTTRRVSKPSRALNQRFILKMMFLTVVGRPGKLSSGKISMRPIVAARPHHLREQHHTGDRAFQHSQEEHHPKDRAFQHPPSVNDLGFFHSIQQLKEDGEVTTAEGLVEAKLKAFNIYPQETLECVWYSLFTVYGENMGSTGNNSYKIPHLRKEQAQRKGGPP
ncbi:unnamed protein product, partial [Discosporangium mesarthrocarpum]